MRKSRDAAKKIHQPWCAFCYPRPAMDQSHAVCRAWAQTAFIMVSQELGFVGSHVHAYRALCFACFAGQAEIKSIFHVFALPAAVQRIALQHLKKQARPAARGVLL